MEEESEAEKTPTPESVRRSDNRWQTGCLVAILALVVLLLLGIWGLSELQQGLDGYG